MLRALHGWTDQRLQKFIGNILRGGVLLAAVVVMLGGTLYLVRHGSESPSYHVFRGEPSDLRSVHGIVTDALSLRGRGLIQFGLLLLIATPVARVAFSVIAFGLQGDFTYVMVTLTVLASLVYSLAGGYL
jgi:uncharacterized membrane protein